MLTPIELSALTAAAPFAKQSESLTRCPAKLSIAQWAEESGWGAHQPGNNCFGVKAYAGCFGRQLLATSEWFNAAELVWFNGLGDGRTARPMTPLRTNASGRHEYAVEDWFATFPTLAQCFAKRGALFTSGAYNRFANDYLNDRNFEKLVRTIAPIYAKDPNYANEILAIASMPQVVEALA